MERDQKKGNAIITNSRDTGDKQVQNKILKSATLRTQTKLYTYNKKCKDKGQFHALRNDIQRTFSTLNQL